MARPKKINTEPVSDTDETYVAISMVREEGFYKTRKITVTNGSITKIEDGDLNPKAIVLDQIKIMMVKEFWYGGGDGIIDIR